MVQVVLRHISSLVCILTVADGVDPSSESHQDGAQLNLPPEVMVRIFRFGIGAVGAINFIPRYL